MCLARGKGALHRLDRELGRVLWFFFDQRLAMREPEAIKVALEFRRELDSRQDDRHGSYSLEELRRQIESQLWFGHIGFVEVVPPGSIHQRPSETTPNTFAASPSRRDDPTWFELTLVDEVGQGIGGQDVQLSVSGKHLKQPTDGGGTVRLDDVRSATSFANARLPDVADLKAALKPRWDTIRADRILTEDDATLVFLRGQRLDTVSLESETPKLVSIQPYVEQARLLGMFFDTNKNFLLPGAIPSLRNIKGLYDRNPTSTLLVVGHTDTSGEPSYNDPLSLERAESVAQYLTDDVAAWLERYGQGVSPKKRWGEAEDLLMIEALGLQGPQLETPIDRVGQSPIAWYQKWHNELQGNQRAANWELLAEDAKIGPKTRAQLIGDYMNFDGTTLPEGIKLLTHGCGENFPLERVEALDPEVSDAMDRRVELFFFDADLGIQPPAPGKHSKPGSLEYPEWCRRARRVHDFLSHANGPLCVSIHAPEDQETRLIVTSESGQPIRVLSLDEAERDDETATFSFIPEFLPSSVQFQVERDGEIETESPTLCAVSVRDALFSGDEDNAAEQVSGGRGARTEGELLNVALSESDVAPTRPKRAAQPSKVVVTIQWDNPNHRFLRKMQVEIHQLEGQALGDQINPTNVPGNYRFALKEDVKAFQVRLSIATYKGIQILDVVQRFRVKRTDDGTVYFHPIKGGWGRTARHPRVDKMGYRSSRRNQSVLVVNVDLLFLDITKHLEEFGDGDGRLGQFLKWKGDTKSDVAVLEYTDSLGPKAWPVIIPPRVSDDGSGEAKVGALLFFKNEALDHIEKGQIVEGMYTNADNANYFQALSPYFYNPEKPGQYFDSTGAREYLNYPAFGWDKQLRESEKRLVVLFPIPHGHGFGALEIATPKHQGVLKSAFVALFAENRIAKKAKRVPPMKRLAIGGWSSGTDTLLKWAERPETTKFVDEIYMFDGKGKKDAKGILKKWFEVDKEKRRVRLFGTAYSADQAVGMSRENNHPNISGFPDDPNYFYDSADYKRSLTTASEPPPQFRRLPTDKPLGNDVSTTTNLYFKDERTEVIEGVPVHSIVLYAPGMKPKRILIISKEEAALLAAVEVPEIFKGRSPIPVKTEADYIKVMNWLNSQPGWGEPNRSLRHRHSWSMFGGERSNGAFVGFFLQCLQKSGF